MSASNPTLTAGDVADLEARQQQERKDLEIRHTRQLLSSTKRKFEEKINAVQNQRVVLPAGTVGVLRDACPVVAPVGATYLTRERDGSLRKCGETSDGGVAIQLVKRQDTYDDHDDMSRRLLMVLQAINEEDREFVPNAEFENATDAEKLRMLEVQGEKARGQYAVDTRVLADKIKELEQQIEERQEMLKSAQEHFTNLTISAGISGSVDPRTLEDAEDNKKAIDEELKKLKASLAKKSAELRVAMEKDMATAKALISRRVLELMYQVGAPTKKFERKFGIDVAIKEGDTGPSACIKDFRANDIDILRRNGKLITPCGSFEQTGFGKEFMDPLFEVIRAKALAGEDKPQNKISQVTQLFRHFERVCFYPEDTTSYKNQLSFDEKKFLPQLIFKNATSNTASYAQARGELLSFYKKARNLVRKQPAQFEIEFDVQPERILQQMLHMENAKEIQKFDAAMGKPKNKNKRIPVKRALFRDLSDRLPALRGEVVQVGKHFVVITQMSRLNPMGKRVVNLKGRNVTLSEHEEQVGPFTRIRNAEASDKALIPARTYVAANQMTGTLEIKTTEDHGVKKLLEGTPAEPLLSSGTAPTVAMVKAAHNELRKALESINKIQLSGGASADVESTLSLLSLIPESELAGGSTESDLSLLSLLPESSLAGGSIIDESQISLLSTTVPGVPGRVETALAAASLSGKEQSLSGGEQSDTLSLLSTTVPGVPGRIHTALAAASLSGGEQSDTLSLLSTTVPGVPGRVETALAAASLSGGEQSDTLSLLSTTVPGVPGRVETALAAASLSGGEQSDTLSLLSTTVPGVPGRIHTALAAASLSGQEQSLSGGEQSDTLSLLSTTVPGVPGRVETALAAASLSGGESADVLSLLSTSVPGVPGRVETALAAASLSGQEQSLSLSGGESADTLSLMSTSIPGQPGRGNLTVSDAMSESYPSLVSTSVPGVPGRIHTALAATDTWQTSSDDGTWNPSATLQSEATRYSKLSSEVPVAVRSMDATSAVLRSARSSESKQSTASVSQIPDF